MDFPCIATRGLVLEALQCACCCCWLQTWVGGASYTVPAVPAIGSRGPSRTSLVCCFLQHKITTTSITRLFFLHETNICCSSGWMQTKTQLPRMQIPGTLHGIMTEPAKSLGYPMLSSNPSWWDFSWLLRVDVIVLTSLKAITAWHSYRNGQSVLVATLTFIAVPSVPAFLTLARVGFNTGSI